MHTERIHPQPPRPDRARDDREPQHTERKSRSRAEDVAPHPPSSPKSEPAAYRTWHPDTCDERRLRRGAR
ncbi:MAG: hypothetical protein IPK07_11800 [Deltaproteobacteria bacterium]|nr:hypothetical protein [Deltaproteobacteria bacterium]